MPLRRRRRPVWTLALCAAAALPAAAQNSDSRPLQWIGAFSDVVYRGEHAGGFTVELWRDGNLLIGLFQAAAGLQGDTPAGLLEEVKFDARGGSLSFQARLTTGETMAPGGRPGPSRDLFTFTGTLRRRLLSGQIERVDLSQPNPVANRQRVRLALRSNEAVPPVRTYADWQSMTKEILRARGPKW